MRSHGETGGRARLRVWLERGAHLVGIAIIAWLLLDALRPRPGTGGQVVGGDALAAELRRWSTAASPEWIHLRVSGTLAPAHRDWLAALAAAGTRVSWDGDSIPPLAVALDPIPDPDGGTRIRVAAPPGAKLVLNDDLGAIDSVMAGAAGARFSTSSPLHAARIRSGPFAAAGAVRDSIEFRRVLVVGRVGWESGMVAGALEERGWDVDTRFALSPRGDVVQGGPTARLDTARYSAVVVLDSASLIDVSRLVRYVRDGGGLVITARAASASGLAPLRVGRSGRRIAAVEPFDTAASEPRRSLALTAIVPAPDAVPLELRDGLVAVAARRVERGRVVVIGYDDTWRWRMAGAEGALERHRAWWAALVAGVADVGRTPRAAPRFVDEAPMASLVERLGPPAAAPTDRPSRRASARGWLLAALAAALLIQWLSRRLRGAP